MPQRINGGPCPVPECGKVATKGGHCDNHYRRLKVYGDVHHVEGTPPGAARAFLDAVVSGTAPTESNGCILWTYSTSVRGGYAEIRIGRKTTYAGRVVLERTVGPKPSDNHSMGHARHDVCGNRHCVAPAHLSWQTWEEQAENRALDGTQPYGADAPSAKHTDAEVAEAVRRVTAGETQTAVARDMGVAQSAISRWVNHGRSKR